MADEDKKEQQVFFNVTTQEPRSVMAPLYSNFLAVSRVASEVQLEFIFLDLNVIASILESAREKGDETEEKIPVQGKTVAKIVMPAESFMQVKEQLMKIFEALEKRSQIKKEQAYDRLRSSG